MSRSAGAKAAATDARSRILAATEELALERGPGNVSIEAVAARAGLSKGGVLYHFRTKADLLAALVGSHIEARALLVEECMERGAGSNALAEALIDAHLRMRATPMPPPSGVLAAAAESPEFLEPLRHHLNATLARLRANSADPDLATVAFLALEGLKALRLFGFDVVSDREEDAALSRLRGLLRGGA
jgi:AcrR family transcriptional regulator